ncbi:3'(2'),5'-bisphosphate nucleotidase CysQ [Salinimicrobium marinum]|uniref:3'(2'),5'-bisphosphate nucleotidase CysQ n=1 Tax=Salinimicrobium marinum TaxID=680283 RepID=A0A918VUE1_9FLAO|nr:3'(2'),5'-bisphosphate nucleotidase CysQ [Salinimicrobium marinum]GHA30097.1 3'(2'),5'-bisphosphate nucleotidase CysQ [Salinimicrobium marinum]
MKEELQIAIKACLEAGNVIMDIYENEDFQVETKADDSPLTIADQKANEVINTFLLPRGIPIISEENNQLPYKQRKEWEQCWIIDPLDGTKEFIKRNGEFTVNVALVRNQEPILGVIYAPAIQQLYYADISENKAYKVSVSDKVNDISGIMEHSEEIGISIPVNELRVVGSRSHMNEETIEFIENLKKKHQKDIEIVSRGSSLKFCILAEGNAHIYPRFAPTMEWDTAAGQAICEAVGIKVISQRTGEVMCYNKKDLLNDFFVASSAH